MRWLRGIKKRVFKKHKMYINIDGVCYTTESYSELIEEASKLQVGDLIYNIYKETKEPIKEIYRRWRKYWAYSNIRVLQITFLTESGYIVYDINDEEWCRLGKELNGEI